MGRLRNPDTGLTVAEFIGNTSMTGPQEGINIFDNVVFLQWKAPDADGYAYTWGADNFIYNNDMKIATHTIFFSGGPLETVDPVQPLIVSPSDKLYHDAWNASAQTTKT